MKIFFLLILTIPVFHLQAQREAKLKALQTIRESYAEKPYRAITVMKDSVCNYYRLLANNGSFRDLQAMEDEINAKRYANDARKQGFISAVTQKAFNRLWMMAEVYRNKQPLAESPEIKQLFQAILHYGVLENSRLNCSSRWHNSCFAVPTASTHIYFALFDLMERIEKKQVNVSLLSDGHKMLGELSRQCWTVPARRDETDGHEISVERFRKHVWWVGGNATGYRPLLQTAAQLLSVEMADVVGEVAVRSISSVSQTTIADDFWIEGITADGAGWGHGMQCLVWGYPIHGTLGSLRILDLMKAYPLPVSLEQEQIRTVLNFLRGSSFYYYKGYVPPMVDRGNMNRLERPYPGRIGSKETDYRYLIPSAEMIRMLVDRFAHLLKQEEQEECRQFLEEADRFNITMPGKWSGYYSGSRYFFNNDDLIKKTDDYYLLVNMASNRVSGLESAKTMAASLNIFTCDGATLFFRKGDEYQRVIGALNLRAWPGITSRLSPEPLVPIENWNGYNSLHPFAAGATSGGSSFAGGFIFEKNNRFWQEKNVKYDPYKDPNPSAFGVKAYKSYFMFDNLLLAMGCGIENKMPELQGDIITTIEQTAVQPDFRNGGVVRNNRFLYQVLEGHTDGTVQLERGKKMTEWQKMCIENKLPETEEEMFHLYINHGKQVKDGSYAYVVACDEAALGQAPVVLSNTKQLQAAESSDGSKIGAVCYVSGTTIETSKGYLKVSAPCALLLELVGNEGLLSVADGLMDSTLSEITVETSIPLSGDQVHEISKGIRLIRVRMKGGSHTGAPVQIKVALK